MNVLIIEDELPTQRMMTELITSLRPDWQILACLDSVRDSVAWLKNHPDPDLIFSDIQLSDGICFEIFDAVQPQSFVIFVTSYDEYAIQAFRVNSVDYLLKPIEPAMLEKSIEKLDAMQKQVKATELLGSDYKDLAEALLSGQKKYRTRMAVPTADGFVKINVNDIAYLYSSQKTTTATTFQQVNHVVDHPLDKLEKQLDPEQFFRANRQFIINIDAVNRVNNWFNGKLVVKTKPESEEKIIVSRERARFFRNWLDR